MKVTNILDARMKAWAEEFAAIYIKDGADKAAVWAMDNVPARYHTKLHPYVKNAFDDCGYKIVYPDDDNNFAA